MYTPLEKLSTNKQARPERRGVSTKRPIEAAKEAVSVLDLAQTLCPDIRRAGAEYKACCPLPDHKDGTPSFTVNSEKNLWFCHGCVRGGDVVELAMFAWGYEKSTVAMAAAALLHEFGHKIPTPPPSWFAKGQRQQPVRDAIVEARKAGSRRRIFKHCVLPGSVAEEIEDEGERRALIQQMWGDFEREMKRMGA